MNRCPRVRFHPATATRQQIDKSLKGVRHSVIWCVARTRIRPACRKVNLLPDDCRSLSKAVVRRVKVLLAVITVSLSLQRARICEATVPNDVRRLWLARLPRVCLIPLPMKLIVSHGSRDYLFRETHTGGTSGRLANRSLLFLGLKIFAIGTPSPLPPAPCRRGSRDGVKGWE